MKKGVKKVLQKIVEVTKKVIKSEKFRENHIICICYIFGMIITAMVLDTKPATPADYKVLKEVEAIYINDISKVTTVERATMYVSKDKIQVNISNDECEIRTIFDKAGNYLETRQKDNATLGLWLVIGIVACGVVYGFLVGLGVGILYLIFQGLKKLVNVIKSKKNERK